MLLAFDIGNTNIKVGLFENGELKSSFRVATDLVKTSDEYGIQMRELIRAVGHSPKEITGVIMSSVVPGINYTIEHMISDYFHITPLIVGPGIKTGLNILYEDPRAVGADRIVNAISAYETWGGPVIVIDFGTATTFSVVSQKGEFLGGVICPGIKTSLEALVRNTAKLPTVELSRPEHVINRTTTLNMQAGIIYGCAGQVAYIVEKMRKELGCENANVVATGGLANLIASQLSIGMHVDPLLTLKGLEILYRKNTQEKPNENN